MRTTSQYLIATRILYCVTLGLFVFGAQFPHLRVWGVNTWAFLPSSAVAIMGGIGAVGLAAEVYFSRQPAWTAIAEQAGRSKTYYIVAGGAMLVCESFFVFFRTQAHFLGDGYTLLSTLGSDNPLIKARGLGEGLVHLWMRDALGGAGEQAALMSYRVLSMSAGILFVLLAGVAAYRLFTSLGDRLIFLFGLLTGGYMLMFFGYVENYALFQLSILLFAVCGLLILAGQLPRWVILVPAVCAIFFHLLGVTLVPAMLYVLLQRTRTGHALAALPSAVKALLVLALAALGAGVFVYLYVTDYYFQFAFVPLIAGQTTVDSYTLFSLDHILDYVNLLILLVPGILVLIPVIFMWRRKAPARNRPILFLLLLTATCLGAVFVLDPKLGMPRDWDLFALPAIPLVTTFLWMVITGTQPKLRMSIAALALMLGVLSLTPRVLAQHVPKRAVAHFTNYLELDRGRSRPGLFLLSKYYSQQGDSTRAAAAHELSRQRFPSMGLILDAKGQIKQNRFADAKKTIMQALQTGAQFGDTWIILSECYVIERKFDSALIAARVANGLNPYNPVVQEQLALSYYLLGRNDKAEPIWRSLVATDSTWSKPLYGLASLYKTKGDAAQYEQYLARATTRGDAAPYMLAELFDFYLTAKRPQDAARVLAAARSKGLGESQYRLMLTQHPELAQWLRTSAEP